MIDTLTVPHIANNHQVALHILIDAFWWLGGAATTLLAIFKVLIPIAKGIKKIIKTANDIETIVQELRPNGGGSVKDQVTQIASDVKVIKSRQTSVMLLSERPMFWADENGNCIAANKELCKLFGATQEQMLGHGWLNFVNKEDRERCIDEWEEAVTNGFEITSYYKIENPLLEKSIPAKYTAVIARDAKTGNIMSICGIVEVVKNSKL